MFRLLLLISMLCSTIPVMAEYFEVDGIYYRHTSEANLTIAVTESMQFYYDEKKLYSGDIEIPERVTYKGKTYTVTSIDEQTFKGCSGLTSVSIPSALKEPR